MALAVVSCSFTDLAYLRTRSRLRPRALAEEVRQGMTSNASSRSLAYLAGSMRRTVTLPSYSFVGGMHYFTTSSEMSLPLPWVCPPFPTAVDPTQLLYEALVAGTLSASNFTVQSALAHTPWLLPPGTKLPYSGMENDLDGLLRTQANRTVRGFPAVTMIFFNHHHRAMLMNCIYSLVKFAGTSTLRSPKRCEVVSVQGLVSAAAESHSMAGLVRHALATYSHMRRIPKQCLRLSSSSLFVLFLDTPAAGVRSYIVLTWDDSSLEACIRMNLPCYNSSSLLPFPIGSNHEAVFQTRLYNQIV